MKDEYYTFNDNFEDCPKVEIRESLPTKLISDEPTILNFKKVIIKVTSN
jgi:hypothetical protein